jgi:hypothetical protein
MSVSSLDEVERERQLSALRLEANKMRSLAAERWSQLMNAKVRVRLVAHIRTRVSYAQQVNMDHWQYAHFAMEQDT